MKRRVFLKVTSVGLVASSLPLPQLPSRTAQHFTWPMVLGRRDGRGRKMHSLMTAAGHRLFTPVFGAA
jgi:hypothetical protein